MQKSSDMENRPVDYSREFLEQQKSHTQMGNAAIAGFLGSFFCHWLMWGLIETWTCDLNIIIALLEFVIGNFALAFFVDIPIALVCAWLSHRMFYRTGLPVKFGAFAMAGVAMLTLTSWYFIPPIWNDFF